MFLALNLIRKNILFLFVAVVVTETLFFALFVGFFPSSMNETKDPIISSSKANLNEISNSFNQLLIRKITNISTDLLYIYKHMMWIYQTHTQTNFPSRQLLNKNSDYYKGLIHTDNIILFDKLFTDFHDTLHIQNFTNKFPHIKYNSNMTEILHVINQPYLNHIIYFANEEDENFPLKNEEFVVYLQEFIVICKTITVRDLFSKYPKNQFLFLYSNTIVGYPMFRLVLSTIPYLIHDYGKDDSECLERFKKNCLIQMFGVDNEFTYTTPYFQGGGFLFGICLNVPMKEYIPGEKTAALCSNYSISDEMTKELNEDWDTTINILNYNQSSNNFSVFYTSDRKFIQFDSTVLQSDKFKKYRLNKDDYSLFHLLYYKLFKYREVSDEEIIELEKEYENMMDSFKREIGEKNLTENLNFTFELTTLLPYFDKYGNKTLKNSQLYKEKFILVLSPIYLNTAKINTEKFIFDTTYSKFMFYTCVISNIYENMSHKKFFWVFFYQKAAMYCLFISIIIFAIVLYYNVLIFYISFLLKPIKESRIMLEKLIENSKEEKEPEKELSDEETEIQRISVKKMRRRSAVAQKEIQLQLFNVDCEQQTKKFKIDPKNLETRQFENLISFIQKIRATRVEIKSNNYQKIYIFNRFQDSIKDNPLQILDCMLIVSISYYNLGDYSNAISCFKNLLRYSSNIKKEFCSGNSTQAFAKKLTGLNSGYINDYASRFKNISDSKFQFKMRRQKIYYSYATIELISYLAIKKQGNEMDSLNYKLEIALKFYKKFLKFNFLFKANLVKIIYANILISVCYFEMKEYNEALESLKKAFISLFEMNNMLIAKKVDIEPRVMLIVNGILLQTILMQVGKISQTIGMELASANILERMMKYSYYSIDKLQLFAVCSLNELFEGNIGLLRKIQERLSDERYSTRTKDNEIIDNPRALYKKKIIINVSKNVTEKYQSLDELNVFFCKMIDKYLCFNDLIMYVVYHSDVIVNDSFKKFVNKSEFIFKKMSNLIFKKNSNSSKDEVKFINSLNAAIDLLVETNDSAINYDMYIFNFGFESDFIQNLSESNLKDKTIEKLQENNISVFSFVLDCYSKRPNHEIINFHKLLNEGIVIKVDKFELIKTVFQSIVPLGDYGKNIFQVNYNFNDYIF